MTTASPEFKSHRKLAPGESPSPAALANERQRTNVPFNAQAWDHIDTIDEDSRDLLRWFHLHTLDRGLSNTEIGTILGYDRTNAFRILSGAYPSSWPAIVAKVLDYRSRVVESARVPGIDKEPSFADTEASKRFWQGIDYASRGGFVILAGESGAGKTKTVTEWDVRHPGRMVRFNAPVTGGHVALVRDLGARIGMSVHGSKAPTSTLIRGLINRIGANQVVVVDQGSRLLPNADQIRATSLELLMELNERCGCGIVIPLTWRAVESMRDMAYQIEQITGRAEIFRSPRPTEADLIQIAMQYGQFKTATIKALHALAMKPGGFRTVSKVLSLADRMARAVKSAEVTDEHVAQAIACRFQNMGGKDPFDQ